MINKYVEIDFPGVINGSLPNKVTSRSITLEYPCSNVFECNPYKLTLQPAVYQFEGWGACGAKSSRKTSLGAYCKGTITIIKNTELYAYIGATGAYNSVKNIDEKPYQGVLGGGATDIRLLSTDNWYDFKSLMTRIFVAAGAGGVEWSNAVGGAGGELNGIESISANGNSIDSPLFNDRCQGATQTSGSKCVSLNGYQSYPGEFGSAGYYKHDEENGDYGEFGGGGYYGGTSYDYSFAGSGLS